MSPPVKAELLRRSDRAAALEHLAGDPLQNLFLLDQLERLGSPPAPGEMRTEIAAARRDGVIEGIVGLRPSVVLDAAASAEAVAAFVPLVQMLGVGLVKSPARVVDELWRRMLGGARRSVLLDRYETAYSLQARDARLEARADGPRVRPAGPEDLEPLVLAARESLREEGRPDPFGTDARAFRRWVAGRVPRARVVVDGDRIVFVGYADVRRREGWLLQGVYTWPEARGRGFARAGVAALCREAFQAGAEHVQLAVVEGNAAGQRLYEGLGFKPFTRLRTILFSEF